MSSMFCAAFSEYKILSSSSSSHENLITSVDRAMVSSMNKNISIMEHALIILSSISSAAPFVGLLGTVWGIMNSFSAIASSQQTNLTVVAPGIAEALLATALGLIAAIPANIAYNRFASTISHSTSALENFRNDFLILISRSLHSS
jgi:biopolymer transport protein TolQ